jgi:ferric-dicitrate binding protein FerR (iron transport regulator)
MNSKLYLDLFEKYMANKATEQEVQQLAAFLGNNPPLNDWLEQQIYSSPSAISDELKQRMFSKIQEGIGNAEHPNNPAMKLRHKKWLRAAAIIILPVAIAFGGYYFYSSRWSDAAPPLIIAAERGEKANLTLPDGSRVWLNSGSKLAYHTGYSKEKRLLELNGEAYFEVAPDKSKEFIVRCKDMQVCVLGTAFNIKAYDEDSIVSTVLVAGKVKITVPGNMQLMHPGERIVYNRSNRQIFSENIEANDFTDWRRNRLRFENEAFQDIAKTIARIHNVDYVFEDEDIKRLRFTGTVDNTNIESLLNAISLTAPIAYTIDNSLIAFRKDTKKDKYFNNNNN